MTVNNNVETDTLKKQTLRISIRHVCVLMLAARRSVVCTVWIPALLHSVVAVWLLKLQRYKTPRVTLCPRSTVGGLQRAAARSKARGG